VGFPYAYCYSLGKKHVPNAGRLIATGLWETLGSDYQNRIHLIGHSLGSGVIAYVARNLLTWNSGLSDMQLTVLDQPYHIERIPGFFFLNSRWDRFEVDFMDTVLGDIDPGRYQIENYFAEDKNTIWDGAGVGTDLCGESIYNHEPLIEPHDVFEFFDGKEGVANNHSGVHLWFRLTIDPTDPSPSADSPTNQLCSGGEWNQNNTDVLGFDGVDRLEPPCQIGWPNSIVHSGGIPYFKARPCESKTRGFLNRVQTIVEKGCSFEFLDNLLGSICTSGISDGLAGIEAENENSPAHGIVEIDIPGGTEYFTFEYRFLQSFPDDHVALLIDGELMWQEGISSLFAGEWLQSGPIPVSGHTGRKQLMIVFYTDAPENAAFELKDFQFILGESIFTNGFE
jgi:hypothetical protein